MSALTAQRLQPLKMRADAQEQDAARLLEERRRELARQERRLDELRRFLGEYRTSMPSSSAVMWSNRAGFVARVGDAISAQQRVVESVRRACDQALGQWLERHRDNSTVDHLIDAAWTRERKTLERREQRVNDENAMRRFMEARLQRGEEENTP